MLGWGVRVLFASGPTNAGRAGCVPIDDRQQKNKNKKVSARFSERVKKKTSSRDGVGAATRVAPVPQARAAHVRMHGEYNVCVCADWVGVPCFRATQHDIAWRMHATTGMPFPYVVGRRGYDTCCCRDLEEGSMRWFAEFSDEYCFRLCTSLVRLHYQRAWNISTASMPEAGDDRTAALTTADYPPTGIDLNTRRITRWTGRRMGDRRTKLRLAVFSTDFQPHRPLSTHYVRQAESISMNATQLLGLWYSR